MNVEEALRVARGSIGFLRSPDFSFEGLSMKNAAEVLADEVERQLHREVNVEAMGEAIDAVQAILDPITDPYERLANYAELLGRLEVLAPEAVLQACQAHHAWHS